PQNRARARNLFPEDFSHTAATTAGAEKISPSFRAKQNPASTDGARCAEEIEKNRTTHGTTAHLVFLQQHVEPACAAKIWLLSPASCKPACLNRSPLSLENVTSLPLADELNFS